VLGLVIAVAAIATLSACFSAGGSLLIWLVGIPLIGLGIELARVFARVERWRMTMVDRHPLLPHAYRPFDGLPRSPYGAWVRGWAEAEFLDASRWRDVVYALVLFPLAILEFSLVIGLWITAVGLVATPLLIMGLRSLGVPVFTAGIPAIWAALMIVAVLVGLVLVRWRPRSRGASDPAPCGRPGSWRVDPTDALRQDVARLREAGRPPWAGGERAPPHQTRPA
jgi:hypothetical protein